MFGFTGSHRAANNHHAVERLDEVLNVVGQQDVAVIGAHAAHLVILNVGTIEPFSGEAAQASGALQFLFRQPAYAGEQAVAVKR